MTCDVAGMHTADTARPELRECDQEILPWIALVSSIETGQTQSS
jgi:hypothetical protein